jgi:eukaryotic-like serine/threonine-protein kinase
VAGSCLAGPVSLKELQLPSIASLRAIAALKSTHLAVVRPARIGLGFEAAAANQRTLGEVEAMLGGPGLLSLPYSLRWLLDAMAGLSVLHRTLGVVHGEVEPEHVILGDDGIGRLLPVVRAHWVRGETRLPERLYYLSPEKLLGDHVDIRSDVFSVGVLLWEAITGQRLIEAYTVDAVIARLMSGSIPRARAPEGEAWTTPLAAIAERAIAVDPARRFATVAEMKAAIEGPSLRYLASTPGMVALFQHPEQRLRGRARESIAPQSRRVTLPPTDGAGADEHAAARLSRPNLSSVDLEEELTKPKGVTVATVRQASHVHTLVGVQPKLRERESSPPEERTNPTACISEPAPAAKSRPAATPKQPAAAIEQEAKTVVRSLSSLLNEPDAPTTIMRVPVANRSPTPPYFRSPTSSMPPSASAKAELGRTLPLAPSVAPPPPVPAPSSAPPPATFVDPHTTLRLSSPPTPADVHRPPERRITASGFPPMVTPSADAQPYAPLSHVSAGPPSSRAEVVMLDPSFELMRPRRRRGALWLLLGAAAAIGAFAARPWIANQLSTAHGEPTTADQKPLDAAQAKPTAPQPPGNLDQPTPQPSVDAPAIGIASTPPSPDTHGSALRGPARREDHVVIHDAVDPSVREPAAPTPAAREPEPVIAPEPAAEPTPPKEEPPPPAPPAPKPKATPVSEADRYGI